MTTDYDPDAPYVPQNLLDALVPGSWVRFRLGEREPWVCEHCGYVTHGENVAEYNGRVYQLDAWCPTFCPRCEQEAADNTRYALACPFVVMRVSYSSFGAYAAELTPVSGPDAMKIKGARS